VTAKLRNGGLIRLQAGAGTALTWAVPVWGTLCGAVASGELELSLADGLRLALALLLVDAGWGAVWMVLTTTDWKVAIRRWHHWRLGSASPLLPYLRPDSPGERILRWLAQLWSWGKAVFLPTAGRALGTALAGLLLSAVLAATLGQDMLMLTLAAFALMQLALVFDRGRGEIGSGWDGVLRVGFPWLAGHLILAPLNLVSTALAAAFSLSVAGSGNRGKADTFLWAGGQLAAAALFLPLHRPLAAPYMLFFLVPQVLLLGYREEQRISIWTWVWLAATMLLSAWAL